MRQPSRSSISFAPEWSARTRIASGVARTNTSKWTKPGSAAAHAAKAEACTTKFWSPAAVEVRHRKPGTARDKRNDGRYAGRVRLAVAADRSAKSLCGFVDGAVAPGTLIVTDDWSGYADLRKRGYDHHAIAECGDSEVTDEFLPIIHLVFANLKTWLIGIHHGVSERHLQAYLNEFTFRFNRRFYPFNAFRSLLGIASDAKAPTYAQLYSGTGITLHLAGVCVNRIGVERSRRAAHAPPGRRTPCRACPRSGSPSLSLPPDARRRRFSFAPEPSRLRRPALRTSRRLPAGSWRTLQGRR